MALLSGIGIESNRLGKAGLALIKGPEFLSLQLQGTCDVQRVQGANTEGGTMPSSEINAGLPGAFGEVDWNPDSLRAVSLEVNPSSLRIEQR